MDKEMTEVIHKLLATTHVNLNLFQQYWMSVCTNVPELHFKHLL
jgi:hypothetical protein